MTAIVMRAASCHPRGGSRCPIPSTPSCSTCSSGSARHPVPTTRCSTHGGRPVRAFPSGRPRTSAATSSGASNRGEAPSSFRCRQQARRTSAASAPALDGLSEPEHVDETAQLSCERLSSASGSRRTTAPVTPCSGGYDLPNRQGQRQPHGRPAEKVPDEPAPIFRVFESHSAQRLLMVFHDGTVVTEIEAVGVANEPVTTPLTAPMVMGDPPRVGDVTVRGPGKLIVEFARARFVGCQTTLSVKAIGILMVLVSGGDEIRAVVCSGSADDGGAARDPTVWGRNSAAAPGGFGLENDRLTCCDATVGQGRNELQFSRPVVARRVPGTDDERSGVALSTGPGGRNGDKRHYGCRHHQNGSPNHWTLLARETGSDSQRASAGSQTSKRNLVPRTRQLLFSPTVPPIDTNSHAARTVHPGWRPPLAHRGRRHLSRHSTDDHALLGGQDGFGFSRDPFWVTTPSLVSAAGPACPASVNPPAAAGTPVPSPSTCPAACGSS